MDAFPDPADVPKDLVGYIKAAENWKRLCAEWNRLYPTNPVAGDMNEEPENGD